MMKVNSKIAIAIILSAFLIPVAVLAENAANGNTQSLFCKNVNKWRNTIETRLEDRKERVSVKVVERDENIASRRETRDVNLESKRDGWDKNREQRYSNLESKAETEEQKQAVAEFKSIVDEAVATRRVSVDAAIDTFRSEVNKVVTTRRQAVNTAIEEFQLAVANAGEKAENDCANEVAAATVRLNYRAALKAAKDKLQTDKQAIDKIGAQVQTLAQTRNVAVKQAVDTFTSELKAAVEQLKASF